MALPLAAETVRIASYNVEMYRKTPGVMLRDILRNDPQAEAVARVIAHNAPDILLLQGVDYDAELHGARALRNLVAKAGLHYPHIFALRPNTGMVTGVDLNGDGRKDGAADAQGFGYFSGQRGMVLFSRWPIEVDKVQDFSSLLWQNLPGAALPMHDSAPFPSEQAQAVQRLSSTGHWIVPVSASNGTTITVMGFAATPPVFDGPEDRNGLRNADEIHLWDHVLDGNLGNAPTQQFFVLGTANLDPTKGQGRHHAIQSLLGHALLQDTNPKSDQHGADTVDWPEPDPGDMRVDYVLPSADWTVVQSGIFWPDAIASGPGSIGDDVALASRHRLVWVDVLIDEAAGF